MRQRSLLGAGLALGFLAAAPAGAHVFLDVKEAPAGSAFKAVIAVPHGCEGKATTAIGVILPEGFVSAKPMPKPGWTLSTRTTEYAHPYTVHGKEMREGVTEVLWSEGSLPDGYYDEFVVRGQVMGAQPGAKLAFKVQQSCGETEVGWTEIAAAGADAHALAHPAPLLTVLAAEAGPGGGHGAGAAHAAHDAQASPESVSAIGAAADSLAVEGAWARASVGANGAAYFTVRNMGDTEDRLVAVRGDVAKAVELHAMSMDGGVMKMHAAEGGIAVPAKGTAELKPGGLHVMLIGLKAPLEEGDTFPLTLVFEKAGERTVEIAVGSISGPPEHMH